MRDRILAVVRGEEHDRVPFVQYNGIAAPNEEIWSVIGRENMGLIQWSSVHSANCPNCRFDYEDIERNGRPGQRVTMHTPGGTLFEERFFEPTYGTASISKHFITVPEDYRAFMAYLRDMVITPNAGQFLADQAAMGEDGVPMVAVQRTAFQQLWILWVSLEDLCIHMVDCPEVMDECIALLDDIQRRTFEVVRQVVDEAPVPFVNIPDNITAPAIGKTYFDRYCVPRYNELADMLTDKNVPIFVHMDGDLKPIWDSIGASKVMGLDSFSPPPDNDTSVVDARSMWPEKRLFLNFPSSVHLASPEEIYATTTQILEEDAGSGRLQVQISENVPRGVWRRSYPEIVRAIRDFAS